MAVYFRRYSGAGVWGALISRKLECMYQDNMKKHIIEEPFTIFKVELAKHIEMAV